jgi:YVTN family beta-propeller protein
MLLPWDNFGRESLVNRIILAAAFFSAAFAQVKESAYVNFEGAQTNPVRLSPDGTRLFAVNTPDARLSVFDISKSKPLLIAEIPVGIEPVSVNPRSSDEAWVVNQVSDSISVVSVSRRIVTDTIYVKDEPADVVFAGKLAFVSVSRGNEVRVFHADTHKPVAAIPVLGENPRALAISPDGKKIYAAFALSGNGTTIIPTDVAPPPPPPENPKLPPAPRQGIIVDAGDPKWSSFIRFTMPDNDVVEIDAESLSVSRYFSRIGTINLGLAVQPATGDLYVANTDARNLVRFETRVRGHIVDSRITRIAVEDGTVTPFDLNPTMDYTILPNPEAKAIALAQPAAVVFDPKGSFLYVAAFGTDRVARVSADGQVLARIEIGAVKGSAADPKNKRGPRGLALNAKSQRLYVLNRISNTISVVDTSSDTVIAELPVGAFDPTPQVIRNGRGFLYDAKLSGNGSAACAACHIDAEMDLLAWDLGNPAGDMQTVVDPLFGKLQMHPMKGPMTTQTLRGLNALEPFHWRGDRATFLDFNPAFDNLLGGSPLAGEDMEAYRDFINTIRFQPNPNQNLDRTLPASFAGGDPIAGRNTFLNEQFVSGVTCNLCHTANPGPGSARIIIPGGILQEPQDFKIPHLRNIYQKLNFNNRPGDSSIGGFGLLHDGSDPTVEVFLSKPVFGSFSTDLVRKRNLSAFLQCFDTGMAPAVGYTRTITADNVDDTDGDWTLLENQAGAGNIDLVVKGTIDGEIHGLLYRPASQDYLADQTGLGPFTRAQLREKIQAGDVLSVMGVAPGSGTRMGIDRNLNGILDGDETSGND